MRGLAWAIALAATAPAHAGEAPDPRCVPALAQAASLVVLERADEAAAAVARCGALPEARLLGCLAQPVAACPEALRDTPAWAAEAHLALALRALRSGRPGVRAHPEAAPAADPPAPGAASEGPARAHLEAALAADPALVPARIAQVVLADARGDARLARVAAAALVARPGHVREPADLRLEDPLRPVARLLEVASDRAGPGCVDCRGVLAFVNARRAGRGDRVLAPRLWREAAASLRSVLQQQPADLDTRLTLGDTLVVLGDPGGAAEIYRAGLAMRPDWVDGLEEAGKALVLDTRYAEAATLLERAVGLDPGRRGAWAFLGRARRQLGHPQALDALRRAAAAPDADAVDALELARALLEAGALPEARARFQQATASPAAPASAWYGLARTLQALGEPAGAARARAEYQRAHAEEEQAAARLETAKNLAEQSAAVLDALAAGRPAEAGVRLAELRANAPEHPFGAFAAAALAAATSQRVPDATLDAVVALCREANPGPARPLGGR